MGIAIDPGTLPLVRRSQRGEPTWELALAYPRQGEWTEAEYLAVEKNYFVELSDGCLEFLPMPLPIHQLIVKYLFQLLDNYVVAHVLGDVFFAPLPIRLWSGKFRDPDIVFLKTGRLSDLHKQPQGADLAIEVVSEGDEARERDLITKRAEYAQAGIAEYWIIDLENAQITVLTLDAGSTVYREHGIFHLGATATSVLLPGFEVSVDAVFAAQNKAQ